MIRLEGTEKNTTEKVTDVDPVFFVFFFLNQMFRNLLISVGFKSKASCDTLCIFHKYTLNQTRTKMPKLIKKNSSFLY